MKDIFQSVTQPVIQIKSENKTFFKTMKRRRKKQKAVTNLWPFVTKELILIPQLRNYTYAFGPLIKCSI